MASAVAESSPPDSKTTAGAAGVSMTVLYSTDSMERRRAERVTRTTTEAPKRFTTRDEEAGARESYEDAVLYDFEYRRRRADVNFYRRIAEEKRESLLASGRGDGS